MSLESSNDGRTGTIFTSDVITAEHIYSKSVKCDVTTERDGHTMTPCDDVDCASLSQSKHISVMSVDQSIQTNDYDIERSGNIHTRRRMIPRKFIDFENPICIKEEKDSDYQPEDDIDMCPVKYRRTTHIRKPGRPRKLLAASTGDQEPSVEHDEVQKSVSPSNNEIDSASDMTQEPSIAPKRGRGRPALNRSGSRKDGRFECDECHKTFTLYANLTAHRKRHNADVPKFTCDINDCTKIYRSHENLRRHKLTHMGIKQFHCSLCQRQFTTNNTLMEHMNIHTDRRPYKCDNCGKTFRHNSVLQRHLITHSSTLAFTCDVCGRQFSQMIYLQSHSRVHTGERPFQCDVCLKNFSHRSDVIRHKIIHTGEKPFLCKMCGVGFTDSSSKRRHERSHSDILYQCYQCNVKFTHAAQLAKHRCKVRSVSKNFNKRGQNDGSKNSLQKSVNESLKSCDTIPNAIKVFQICPTNMLMTQGACRNSKNNNSKSAYSRAPGQHEISVVAIGPETDNSLERILYDNAELLIGSQQTVDIDGDDVVLVMGDVGDARFTEGRTVAYTETIQHDTNINNEGILTSGLPALESDLTQRTDVNQHSASQNIDNKNKTVTLHVTDLDSEIIGERIVELHCESEQVSESLKDSQSSILVQEEMVVEIAEAVAGSIDSEPLTQLASIMSITDVDYVKNPDFSCQEYYDWLSAFTQFSKQLLIPIRVDFFHKISHVQKTLSDILATPSGVLSLKENFKILMSITKDLNMVLNKHLSHVLDNMEKDGNS